MKKARLILSAVLIAAMGLGTVSMSSCNNEKDCNVGYEGKDCKVLSRTKFIGSWKGDENCSIGLDNYTITVAASGSSEIQLVISNVYNQSFVAQGTMTGENNFTFSGSEGTTTYQGTGKLNTSNNDLELDYSISGLTTNTCSFKGAKL